MNFRVFKRNSKLDLFLGFLALSFLIHFESLSKAEDSKFFTLLHTNDLHSHFRPEKTPLSLGGG